MVKKSKVKNTPQEKIAVLGRELFKLKAQKKRLTAQLSFVEVAIKDIAEVKLAKLMGDAEIEKISLKGRGTLYMSDVLYASVLKENREKLYKWMRDNGHGSIVVDFIFPSTLTAFAKEMLEKQEPLPDVVKTTIIPTAKTRAKGGAPKDEE